MYYGYSVKYEQNCNICMYIRILGCMLIFHLPKIIVRNTGRFAGSTSRSMRNGKCQINCILNERLRCLVVDETEFLKVIRRNSGRKETKLFWLFSDCLWIWLNENRDGMGRINDIMIRMANICLEAIQQLEQFGRTHFH